MRTVSAIVKKSFRDLTRHRARTIFAIATIALGVMGIGLLAIQPLADRAAAREVGDQNLYNLRMTVSDVELNGTDLVALKELPNVQAVEGTAVYFTKMYIGERLNGAFLVGVRDFADQKVDKVLLDSGRAPGPNEVLTHWSNSRNGIYDGEAGDAFDVIDHTGSRAEFRIAGVGQSLARSNVVKMGYAVFFADIGTVRSLSNLSGYNQLSFRLENTDGASVNATVEAVRAYISAHTTTVAFSDLPEVLRAGDWPGRQDLANMTSMAWILTMLALLCSVFLISNTMNTMVLEQRRQVAQMKAIGATRTQVLRSFLTTSFILGGVGALTGAVLGLPMVNLILPIMCTPFGFVPGFSVDIPIFSASVLAGVGIVLAASLPAILRSSAMGVREGLEGQGISADYGKGWFDRLLMRGAAIPSSARMGLRNVARKKGRSAATILQIALAVGVLLGLPSFGQSLVVAINGIYDDFSWDMRVAPQTLGGVPFNESTGTILEGFEGVRSAEPFIAASVQINGKTVPLEGYMWNTTSYKHGETLLRGRWFSSDDERTAERVIVISDAVSQLEGLSLGGKVALMTATGRAVFTIIGIDNVLRNNGQMVYAPLGTMQEVLRIGDGVTGFFLRTESADHSAIDRTSTRVADGMLARGYVVDVSLLYVMERIHLQGTQSVLNLMYVVSLIIILISLIGLVSTLTMNILDRTREIGMMRCIGSGARDIRNMFSSEGVFLSLVGWVVGLPMGVVIAIVCTESFGGLLKLHIPLQFPLGNIALSLAIAIGGTVLIVQAPILRATRLRPGDALRYQ
jgi:putative ABC transport system permease protein